MGTPCSEPPVQVVLGKTTAKLMCSEGYNANGPEVPNFTHSEVYTFEGNLDTSTWEPGALDGGILMTVSRLKHQQGKSLVK